MAKEYYSLQANKTWTSRPEDRKSLRAKWVYKLKRGSRGEIVRYKALWVVRGFEQEKGFEVQETFTSVVKPMSHNAMCAIATALDLKLHQMDVKPAFLHGLINDLVYVEQPERLDERTGRVFLLNKALYGLIC